MWHRPVQSSRVPLKQFILTTTLLFSIFLSFTNASGSYQAKTSSMWTVSITGLNGLVCIGDSYMLTAKWETNSDVLAPLEGPRAIQVKARLGSFDPETARPGTTSGTTQFNYTPEKAGYETVTIQVFNRDLEVDSQSTASFEVKKCNYRYSLLVESFYWGQEVSLYGILKSSGLLEGFDPVHPRQADAIMKKITWTAGFTQQIGDCAMSTLETDHAVGQMDVKTVEADKGEGVKILFGQPGDFKDVHDVTIKCGDTANRQLVSVPVNIKEDPWIEEEFPLGEGERNIKIAFFDDVNTIMRSNGYSSVYIAKLTLKREAAQ